MILFVLFIFLISGWCKTVIRTRYIGERANFNCHYKPALSKTHKHLCKRTTDTGKFCEIIASTGTKISPMKRFFIHDDAESRVVTVTINPVSDSDSGEYWCGVMHLKEEIIIFETVIFWAIPRTGYIGGELQMKCPYGGQYEDKGKYLHKLGSPTSLIHIEGGQKRADNGRFSLYDNTSDRELVVTITDLEAEDSGKYMCGINDAGQYPERQLTVKSVVSVTEYEGHNINISCKYQNARSGGNQKHFCQGQDPVKCLEQGYLDEDRLSLENSTAENLFTVTISDLRAEDAGIYWCVEFGVRGPEFTSAVQIAVRRESNSAIWWFLPVVVLMLSTGILLMVIKYKKKSIRYDPAFANTGNTQNGDYENDDVQVCTRTQANPPAPPRSDRENSITEYSNSEMVIRTPAYQTVIVTPQQNNPATDYLNDTAVPGFAVYQTLNVRDDDIYHSLHPTTNQNT